MVLDAPFILTVNPEWAQKNQIRSAKDVIAFAKGHPDKLSYGSAGPGNIAHLAYAAWSNRTSVKTTHVPYKSASQAQMAVLSGELDTQFDTWSALPHIASGKLVALAVTAPRRMQQLPEVPTMAEAGYADFDVTFWAGLLAPAGTPPAIVKKLNQVFVAEMKQPDVLERFKAIGAEVAGSTPEEAAKHLQAESVRWTKVITERNISMD